MSLPDEMSHTSRTNPRPDPLPRSLLVALLLLVLLGVASTAAAVIGARATSEGDRRLLERLSDQEEQSAENAGSHRVRNEVLHDVICRQNQTIAGRFSIPIPACPPPVDVEELTPPNPEPSP